MRIKEKTKEVILRAATHMTDIHGIEGLTIGELAKAVGMSKSGLFAHFKGRDDLQLKVLENATQNFIERVLSPSFKKPRGEPRLRALFENWINHLNSERDTAGGRILISVSLELDDRPGVLRDYIHSVQKQLIQNLEKAARLAIEEGHFRKDLDIGLFAWTLYSFVLGYYHFKRMLEDSRAEEYLQKSFKTLMNLAQANSHN